VDEDLLSGLGLVVVVGSFNEFAGLEAGAGTDERDEVWGVHGAPAACSSTGFKHCSLSPLFPPAAGGLTP